MRAVDIIQKKRDGQALTNPEIDWFITGYTRGDIPDYQAAALLMAIYLRGMNREEIVALTLAMAQSGHMLDLSDVMDYAIDKHSSGGVGDKTTLVVLPLVAACGVPVAKMSGRGLGFSGGTLDKMEAIAGYNVNLTEETFRTLARNNGIVLSGQTGELAPADGKLYALRDVTGTVASIPLIASSIMSKKLASGTNGVVLDVKWGSGAFMSTLESARELAQIMVDIGTDAGRDVIAVISDMNQPLGYAVGNAMEVVEAIDTLHGGGAPDLREHSLEIAAYMLRLAGRGHKWTTHDEARATLEEKLSNGDAFGKFRQLVAAQGGDVAMVDNPRLLPKAHLIETIPARHNAYVARVSADLVARASLALGAGRAKKGDPIDLGVGIEVHVKVGQSVKLGVPIFVIHANDEAKAEEALTILDDAIGYSDTPIDPLPLFYGVIEGERHTI